MQKYNISIIVPVYKAEKYLHRCVDSILAQTFTDWECILVDDGSPDGSGAICDEYAAKDARIQVIHKENGGVSSARNAGMDNATGEWITFIDSDDYVATDYLDSMMKLILENKEITFVHSGAYKTIKGEVDSYLFHKDKYISNDVKYLIENFEGYPFSKMYKKQYIDRINTNQKLRFDENMKICEDLVFTLEYLCYHCDYYAFIDYNGYFYSCDNVESAMNIDRVSAPDLEATRYKSKRLLQALDKLLDSYKLSYTDVPQMTKIIAERVSASLFNIYKMKLPQKIRLDEIRKDWQTSNPAILDYCQSDPIRRLSFYLLKKRDYYLYDVFTSLLYIIWKLRNKL